MATKRKTKKDTPDIANFEDSTQQLESLIETLEDEETTLEQALQAFEAYQCDALYVQKKSAPTQSDVVGIVTISAIQNYYQPREFRHAVD